MGKCDAVSGVLFSACLPVSQSLRSDARCCNADSRVVSPTCLYASLVFPACGQMPDSVTLAPGSCLSLVSLCLRLRSDARCCDALGWCLPLVSQFLPVSAVAPGSCLPLVSLFSACCDAGSRVVFPACLPVSPGQRPDAVTRLWSCFPLARCVSQSLQSDARC